MPRSSFLNRVALLAGWLLGSAMWGGVIVGIDNRGPGGPSLLYLIDPQTGEFTPRSWLSGVALSQGPVGGTILYSTGPNLYERNVGAGQQRQYVCTSGFCGQIGDHAYDSSTGRTYALGTLYPLGAGFPNPVTVLVELHDSGVPYPGVPNSTQIGYSFIGPLGVQGITTIEWVPGYGLLGTDGYQALHQIDLATGQASLFALMTIVLPVTGGITPINGLAYDKDTGRLLGSSPAGVGVGGLGLARLYVIDIVTDPNTNFTVAMAGWLNESPPSLTGIAAMNPVPEPGSMVLAGLGLMAVALAIRGGRADG